MKSWIQMYSGLEVDYEFDYEHPELFQWPIVSVAHHLAYICRYTGAPRRFYSVAEHCSRVALYAADLVRQYGKQEDAFNAARAGLVHDFTEAPYGDVNSPLKNMPFMAGYKRAEEAAHPLVARRFNTHKVFVEWNGDKWDVVRCADLQALEFERVQLLGKAPHPWRQNHLLPVVESNAFRGELGMFPEQAETTLLKLAEILDVK